MNDIPIFGRFFSAPAVRAAFAVALLLFLYMLFFLGFFFESVTAYNPLECLFVFFSLATSASRREHAPMLVASFAVDHISVIMLFSISIIDRNETNAHSTLRFDQ